jgi:adenylate kinase
VRAINPNGLILLEAPAELVFERRQKDLRLRPPRSVEQLQLQMNIAREVCENYGRELSLPLEIGAVSQMQDLDALINRMAFRHQN